MFNVRLAGGHLYGKQLFTWLSLVVSFMASFVLSFFTLDVLDEIWDLIESVSEGFLTYSFIAIYTVQLNNRVNDKSKFYTGGWGKPILTYHIIDQLSRISKFNDRQKVKDNI